MKKTISYLATLLVVIAMGINTPAMAQHRHHHSSHRSTHSNIHHAVHDVETATHLVMLGSAIASTTDYSGFRLGINGSTLRTANMGDVDSDLKSGLNIGYVWGWYLGRSPLIIEPGIYYSMKGGSLSGSEIYNGKPCNTKLKTTMHSLEIPLVFKYEVLCRNTGVALHPFIGGFVGLNCGGETKEDNSLDGRDTFDTIGDGDGQLGVGDAGIRLGCGMCAGHFYMELAYDLGCVNLASDTYGYFGYDNFDSAVRSNTVSLNIGFNF